MSGLQGLDVGGKGCRRRVVKASITKLIELIHEFELRAT